MKPLRAQYTAQLERARLLHRIGGWPLALWVVDYPRQPDIPVGVCIVGHAILPVAVDIWRERGARCHRICSITLDPLTESEIDSLCERINQ